MKKILLILLVCIIYIVAFSKTYNGLNVGIVIDVPFSHSSIGLEIRGDFGFFVCNQDCQKLRVV